MQKWEIKRLYVKFGQDVSGEEQQGGFFKTHWSLQRHYSFPDDDAKAKYAEAEDLASQGWELVSIVPNTEGHQIYSAAPERSFGAGCSVTAGLWLWFKRPVE